MSWKGRAAVDKMEPDTSIRGMAGLDPRKAGLVEQAGVQDCGAHLEAAVLFEKPDLRLSSRGAGGE